MPRIETAEQTRWNMVCYMVDTPSGKMFVHVMENKQGDPVGIQVNIGKAGSEVLAWAQSVARLCSAVLDMGGSVADILVEISGLHADKERRYLSGEVVRSGIQGLEIALRRYQRETNARRAERIGYTPSRMGV